METISKVQVGKVTLDVNEYGFPEFYTVSYFEKCIPGVAVESISWGANFTTREEAIRYAKFSMRGDIDDWSKWAQDPEHYPNEKNRDNVNLTPTFIATVGNWPETSLKTVTVRKSDIRQVFDWWAKEADGGWNR